ncbi:hypothetical protein A2U01_0093713, partial [Trifolium medium]|nr:hypothetical protein [Trifolium medium]
CATRHCNLRNAPRPEASQANCSATAQCAVPSGATRNNQRLSTAESSATTQLAVLPGATRH